MKIPEGVNYIQFYHAAKAKGIKIKSKYKGVHVAVCNSNTDIVWGTKITGKNGKQQSFLFPFTKEGEDAAYKKYLSLRVDNKTNP